MAKQVEIELNSAGIQEMLKSQEMQAMLSERAAAIAARAGSGYATSIYVGKTRANASVFPDDDDAARDNMKNNTLLKAVGDG